MTAAPTAAQPWIAPLRLSDKEVKFYNEEGYLFLPGLLSEQDAAALRAHVVEVMATLGCTEEQLNHATGPADRLRQCPRYLRGSIADRLVNDPALRDLAGQLVGGPAYRYLPFTAVKCGGGGGSFDFHQDNQYTWHDPPLSSLNIWIALDRMTPENGCLQICPRSHQQGTLEAVNAGHGDAHRKVAVDPEDFLPVRMRPGDAVAFTRLTVHGSGPNQTDRARIAYALQFHREDTRYRDPETGELKSLLHEPRWSTEPVDELKDEG